MSEHPEQERPEDAEAQQDPTEQGEEQKDDAEGYLARRGGLTGEDEESPKDEGEGARGRRF